MEEHVEADPIDPKNSKVQWPAIKIYKKRMQEVSINLPPTKGYLTLIWTTSNQVLAIFYMNVEKRATATRGMHSSSPIT